MFRATSLYLTAAMVLTAVAPGDAEARRSAVERRYSGKVVILKKRPPMRFSSEGAWMRFLRVNKTKHGVSFADAAELLESDADFLETYDADHSLSEDRFIAVGPTKLGILVVVYTEVRDDVIRIVSARRATRQEKARYEAYWRGDHE